MNILTVENIKKTYNSKFSKKNYTALKDISFSVKKGEFLAIMGPSGSGKTTLLNTLGSIDKPSSGKVIIDNNDVLSLSKSLLAKHRRNNIGFIFQDYNLLETMTLRENIILPLALSGAKGDVIETRLQKLTGDLGLSKILNKYPYEVSGGEQQRASTCRALITRPKVVLADEPTGNLDTKSSKNLLELLTYVNASYETTIVMVTHDIMAASYCDRVLFIRDGELYNEVYALENKKDFYNYILDIMSTLGGN